LQGTRKDIFIWSDVMSKNIALIVAGAIFIIVAILHLIRLILKLHVTFGQWEVPMFISMVGLILAGVLGLWMFTSAAKK
jgi:uncharacterized integral membrane protein